MLDKITALAAPPGNSLTGPPGKWAWEQPARFPNPDDAIDFITDTISNGPAREDMLKLMMAGITIEELTEQVAFKGFMSGAYTPDVAEVIKPAVGIFLYAWAKSPVCSIRSKCRYPKIRFWLQNSQPSKTRS